MGDILEPFVAFVKRVNEMLDFSHLELSDSQQGVSGGNFVSESQTDLSSGKWKSASIVVQKFVEIDEHTLGSFWS